MFRQMGEGPEFRTHGGEMPSRHDDEIKNEPLPAEGQNSTEALHDPTFQQALKGIEKAKSNAVIFVGAITAPQNEHAFEIRSRGDGRGQYGNRFKQLTGKKERNITVITREEIGEGYNLREATEHAIKEARKQNPNGQIIVESPFLFEGIVKTPWENGGRWTDLLTKKGLDAKEEFVRWLSTSTKEDAEGPKLEAVLEELKHAKGEIKEFIETCIKGPFTLELPINPATLAMITYLSTEELNSNSFSGISSAFKSWEGSVAAIHFNSGRVQVTVGDVEIAAERPVW